MENRDDFDNKSKNIKNRKTLKPLREHTGNLKEKNGITMVALVVTIVVLLILSTITIQGITHTGLFSSAEKAKLDHKRAYIATTLETKLKISQSEQIRGTDEEIIKATYEDVKNDLDEIKKAGGKDIEVGEVTSEEREGKTEWFFEVKVDGDVYKVALDGSDYLGKENELSPLIQIKTVKSTTNTISVSVTTKRNEGGKVEYYIKEKAASKFTLAKTTDQNEYTYTGLKQDTTFVIKAIAIGKNGKEKESKEVEIETSTVPKIDSKEIEFAVEPNTWTNKSVKVTAKPKVDTQGFTLVTSKNPTSSWTKVDNQTFSTNGTMYVALTDGNNYGVTASHEVTNIDKIKPVITSVTATTNTIKITATDEASGICAYAISESSTMPTKFTVVDSTKIFNKIIENKKQSTKYYVWVKDQAGNVSEVASTTTGTVAGLTDANTTFSKTPNDWTNKDVTLTASTTEKNFALQTKKDNGEWQTTGTQTFTENGTIYARLWDGINAGAETKLNVTNIDKLAPNAFTPKATVTTNSIKVDGTTTDAQATSTNGSSGIKEYRFSKDGGKTYTNAQTSATYTFGGLTQNVEYTIVVEAKDNAGNTTIGTVKATTGTVPTASGATYTPTTWTKGNVTVTLPTKSGYSTVYTTNGTVPTVSSAKYTAAFSVSTNCKINYLFTDGTNIGGVGTVNVTNIDTLAPNAFTPKATATTNSIKVDGTTTDATATSTNGSSGIKEYRFSKDGGKTYTNAQTSATYTFSGLTQNVEYTIVVEAKDNAGNTTTGTVKATTGTVPTASGATYTPTTWTSGKVTVTLPTKSGYTTVYTTNGTAPTKDSTKYLAAFTVSSNCKINYLYTDGTNIGGAGTVNVTNIDTANPVINTAITGSGTTSTIKLSMAVSDTQSGVNKIIWYYKLSTDSTYKNATDTYTATTANTTRTHTFTGLTQNKTYNAYAVVYDATGRTAQSTTINVTTGTVPTASGATYTPNTWTSGKVTVTLPTKSGYTTVYTTNGTAPTKDSTKYSAAFTVSSNCKINYLYTDGTNIGGAGTVNVTNIDTTAPTFVSGEVKNLTTTGYDVYVYGITDTQSGVNRVQFPTWTNANGQDDIQSNWWEPSNTVARGTKQADGTTWVYHVNIKDHKNEVGLYYTHVYIYDNLGNSRCVFTPQITVPKVPDITSANASFSYNPNTWTSGSVRATTSTTVSGYYLQTSTDAQTWKTQNYVDRTTNGAVYARLTDGVNVGNYVTGNVGNIDKIAPTTPTLTAKIGNDSGSAYTSGAWTNQAVIITATSSDTQSQINRIEYSYDNSTWNTNWGTSLITSGNNKSIKGTWGTNYNTTVYVRAVDNAGNVSGTASIVVRHDTTAPATPTITAKVGSDSGSAYTSGSWTSQPIIITATSSDTQSQINRIEYSYNNSSWSTSWGTDLTTNGNSKSIKGTWNGNYNNTVYVRAVDNVGNVSASSSIVIREDATAPTINTGISGTATSKSITLSLVASDNLSGVNKIVWYYKDSTASSYTSATDTYTATTAQTTRTHTFTGLTQNKTYNAYAVVYDAVGRTTQSSTINVSTVQVPNLATTNGKFTYSTTNWTNGNVTATASTTTGGYSIQTSTDASNWSTNASISRSSNGKVYARLWDGKNAGGYLTGNISNIDKTNISISSFTASPSSTIATVATLSTTVNDANSGLSTIVWQWGTTTNYGSSSTSTYTTKNGATAGTTGAVTKTFSLTGLRASTTYYVKMTAYDVAGNANTSTTSFTTGKAVAQVGSVYYTSVQNAINSATNDATVNQLVDQTESVLIEENKSIKLNTNGKKLQGTKDDNTVTNKGKLTINGNGTITSLNQVVINNTGTLTLDEGSIIAGVAGHHVVENYNLFNMNGGYIELTIKQITCSVFNYKGTFTMKGGRIDSEGHALVSRGGKAEINGKNITITGKNSSHRCMYADENGTINVKGATIVGTIGYENGSNFGYLTLEDCNMSGVSAIYGRTFETISSADGYRVLVYDRGNWLTQVRLPTWTVNGGQDDIVWHDASKGDRCNTTAWYYDIKKSQHKNESGTYITHIYCYKDGTLVYSAALSDQNVK